MLIIKLSKIMKDPYLMLKNLKNCLMIIKLSNIMKDPYLMLKNLKNCLMKRYNLI